MRRYVFVTLLVISSVSFGSSLNFDSDTGVSFNFDMGQFNIFVGYRYSGFDYLLNYNSWGVHTLGGVDPFNQAGYLLAGAFLSVADLYLEGGVDLSAMSSQETTENFIEQGALNFYLKTLYKLEKVKMSLLMKKTLLNFYTDTRYNFTFTVPPMDLEHLGVALVPSVILTVLDEPRVEFEIGYTFRMAWTKSLPSALIDLKGFKIGISVDLPF